MSVEYEYSKKNTKEAAAALGLEPPATATSTNTTTAPFLLDVPLFSILLKPLAATLSPIWNMICRIRWIMTRPLNTRILPTCFPSLLSFFKLKHIPHICYGEVLFLVPIAIIILLSVDASIWNKSVTDSGKMAALPLLPIFLTANKTNSLITFVLGIPYERMIIWHKLWAMTAVAAGGLHLYCAYYLGQNHDRRLLLDSISTSTNDYTGSISDERYLSGDSGESHFSIHGLNSGTPNFLKFTLDGDTNTTGAITLLTMAILVVTSSITSIRRFAFELWYIPHIIGALVAAIFAFIHGASEGFLVIIWWSIDLLTRYVLMAGILYPKSATLRLLISDDNGNDGIVEMSFPKPKNFEYEAGQYIMIAIPKLSFTQFHPFSISSSPHQDTVTLHMKALGRWTKKLVKLAKENGGEVSFLMEGPYGKLMVELENRKRYNMVLMISGGIGITPMHSIANSLLHQRDVEEREIKRLHFVWVVRSLDMLRAMQDTGDRSSDGAAGAGGSSSSILDQKLMVNEIGSGGDDVELSVYLTKKTLTQEENMDKVKMGRPNFDEIFQGMKDKALEEGETSVAVLVCGPGVMVDVCREACRRYSDGVCRGGVTFDFHEETFEL
jgi:NADPH oxidase